LAGASDDDLLGLVDGDSLGEELGAADGKDVVGCIIGPPVGSAVGFKLGASDDDSVGQADGVSLGNKLGEANGNDVIGCIFGPLVGSAVGLKLELLMVTCLG
jgi:hypothetical protein